MFKLSGNHKNTDHLEITITPNEWFKNNQINIDHALTQIIKDHFAFLYGQKHRNEPFAKLLVNSRTMADLIYDVDETLHLESFIDNLVPKISLITFYNGLEIKTYRYLNQENKTLTFEQVKYNNDYNPVIKIPILK
jgi:hypothetical protein